MENIILYGAGQHAKVVAEIAELNGYKNIIFYDDCPTTDCFLGYKVMDFIPDIEKFIIISIGNNRIRKKVASCLQLHFIRLFHPRTSISNRSSIDEGTVVMAGVTINCEVKIGKHCIINTNASIDHDSVINDYVHISPNVALAGNVEIGEGSHIGIGACIIQGVKIGKWCTIGAGAVIIRDIPDGVTVVGNPGRIIK